MDKVNKNTFTDYTILGPHAKCGSQPVLNKMSNKFF
jgi:hypothetical protein